MYARVATFEGDPANVDEAIGRVKGEVEGGSRPPGLGNARGMMMFVNRASGKGMGLTFFENEDDLKRGDEALNNINPGGGGRRTSVWSSTRSPFNACDADRAGARTSIDRTNATRLMVAL
jgi:hypothetical protein